MPTDWTNEVTLKFLEFYASERVLWDYTDVNHKLKHKTRDAWKRISEKMDNTPIQELKAKKKSLMATFRPLMKRKQASIRNGADADEVFQPVWFAFDLMEGFLGKVYEVEETINTEDPGEESLNTMLLSFSQTTSIESEPNDEILNSTISVPPSQPSNDTKPYIDPNNQRVSKKTSVSEAHKRIHENFDHFNNVEDECDLYARLLAKKLRKYPERVRDRMMYKIDGLLLDNPPEDQ